MRSAAVCGQFVVSGENISRRGTDSSLFQVRISPEFFDMIA